MQLGVLDRHAALKRTGVLMDVSFGQGVVVDQVGIRHRWPWRDAVSASGPPSARVSGGRRPQYSWRRHYRSGAASTVTRIPEGIEA